MVEHIFHRFLLAQAAALPMVAPVSSVTLDIPRLPAPAFADREAADDTAILR